MKKFFILFAAFVLSVVTMSALLPFRASAATILPTDTSSPQQGCTFLGIEGKYITQIQEALDLINKIRLEACEEGVENPSTGKPLTPADYVPIKWSSDLEYIARIRAAEASITMAHARLNGESIWGVQGPNGVRSYGEVIAWNWGETMTGGINQWYAEKSAWVNSTGGVTGHYTQMIDPTHTYVGLATFCSSSTRYYNTTVGEFNFSTGNLDTSRGSATGNIIQTVEVKDSYISYEISGTDTLSVSASVNYDGVVTKGLTNLGGTTDNIVWSSSDSNIVTVSNNGKLTVKKCGSAVITAKLPDGSTLKKTVTYEHSYKTTTTSATCGKDGKTVKTCSVCGDTSTTVIPKTNNHSYKTTTTAATCVADGKTVKTCSVCGDTSTTVIPKTNNHSYKTSTTAATCAAEGKIVDTCSVCGDTKTQTIPKLTEHSYGDWTVTKAPTESSPGTEKRTCSVCHNTETRTLTYQPPASSSSSSSSTTSSSPESSTPSSSPESSTTSSSPESSTTSSSPESSTASNSPESSTASSSPESSTASSSPESSTLSSSSESSTASSSPESSTPNSSSESSSGVETNGASGNGGLSTMLIALIAGGAVLVIGAIIAICVVVKRKKRF